ncbi:hypothetical protein [Microbispora rosea]|uniref:hypothetical protein n=1 Tax=Microbispora rosea TaxID=58117 RepID=UPI003D901B60
MPSILHERFERGHTAGLTQRCPAAGPAGQGPSTSPYGSRVTRRTNGEAIPGAARKVRKPQ